MKRWMSIILGTMLAVMCVMNMTVSAFADAAPGVSIPVTVSLSGTLPESAEDFTIKLRADDASYPMPEGSKDGVYAMTVNGAGTKNLPTVTYDRVGIYTYTISQVAGTNSKCTYDDSVYTLTVYITNAEDGSGLEASAVLYPDAKGDKLPGAAFANVYETVKPTPEPVQPSPEPVQPTPTPQPDTPKTGDDFDPMLYAGLIAASMGVFVVLLLTRKKGESEE